MTGIYSQSEPSEPCPWREFETAETLRTSLFVADVADMDPSEVVIKYLRGQNRPYSSNDIFNNLHEEIKKPAVQKALDHLVEQGRIAEKVYGKQKVYVVKQEDTSAKDLERELQDLDSKLNAISKKVASAEQELKGFENQLHELQFAPTTNEAKNEKTGLENKVKALKEKVDIISKNIVKISETDKKQIQSDHENKIKEWRKKKRVCMDIVEAILEGYHDSKRALLNKIGIETDEDVGMPLTL
jgi:26S proteasome regulatory subunit (ATPase 3-interacting protein)